MENRNQVAQNPTERVIINPCTATAQSQVVTKGPLVREQHRLGSLQYVSMYPHPEVGNNHTLGSESGLLFSCCKLCCLDCCILDSAAIDSALFCIANSLEKIMLLIWAEKGTIKVDYRAMTLAGVYFLDRICPQILGSLTFAATINPKPKEIRCIVKFQPPPR